MRKLSALIILIVVFFPVAFTAMALTSIRPWILDRGFYQRLVSDEGLYEAPNRFDGDVFTPVEQLPLNALGIALHEVVTTDYLRAQSLDIINRAFDYIDGHETTLDLSLDITPIKAALAGEGKTRFATALAAALPACADGQPAIAPGGHLTRCIAADASVESAAQQIADALPAALENTPDQIVLNNQGYGGMNAYGLNLLPGGSVRGALDISVVMTIFVAAAAGMIGAYLGGDDLRGRLKWLSSALFFPASLFLFAGLVLVLPVVADPIRYGVISANWSAGYSETFRQAVANLIVPIIRQVGSGFLITGVITSLIALALLIWSWLTPAGGKESARIVQIPVRNS